MMHELQTGHVYCLGCAFLFAADRHSIASRAVSELSCWGGKVATWGKGSLFVDSDDKSRSWKG